MLKELPNVLIRTGGSDESEAPKLLEQPLVPFEVLKQTITSLPELIQD